MSGMDEVVSVVGSDTGADAGSDAGSDGVPLYGLVDAEVMWLTPREVYLEWLGDCGEAGPHAFGVRYRLPAAGSQARSYWPERLVIERWSSNTLASMLMPAEHVVEYVAERVAEETCGGAGAVIDRACADVEVVAAFADALRVLGSKLPWRQADRLLGTHEVTWDADGEPLFDGVPLFPAPAVLPG